MDRVITTQRLVLRPLKFSDIDDFYEYAKDPDVGPPSGWKPHESKLRTFFIIRELKHTDGCYAVEYKGKMIGTVSLREDDKRPGMRAVMVGYSLNPAYWNMGLATEAVKELIKRTFERKTADTVAGYCYPENTASRRVLEKAGLSLEGILKKSYLSFDDKVGDIACYLITAEEYSENTGNEKEEQ